MAMAWGLEMGLGGAGSPPLLTEGLTGTLPSQAHNDMLQTFEAKLTAFGIPLDNLGFQPLSFPFPGQELGQGPAGLVAVPT